MADPIPLRPRAARPSRGLAGAQAKGGPPIQGPWAPRAVGSARPQAYHRRELAPPLRWRARLPHPHPIAWAVVGCVAFWWTVICAVRF